MTIISDKSKGEDKVIIKDNNGNIIKELDEYSTDAVPFIVLEDFDIILGVSGQCHYFMELDMDDNNDNRKVISEGRAWTNHNIISFWLTNKTIDYKLIDKIINKLNNLKVIKKDNSLIFMYNGKGIPYLDFMGKSDNTNASYEYNNKMKPIHLMNQKDKFDALKDYRKEKNRMYAKIEKENDVNSIAQWRARQSTSEQINKNNANNMKKTIKLTETDMHNIIRNTIKRILNENNDEKQWKINELEEQLNMLIKLIGKCNDDNICNILEKAEIMYISKIRNLTNAD